MELNPKLDLLVDSIALTNAGIEELGDLVLQTHQKLRDELHSSTCQVLLALQFDSASVGARVVVTIIVAFELVQQWRRYAVLMACAFLSFRWFPVSNNVRSAGPCHL